MTLKFVQVSNITCTIYPINFSRVGKPTEKIPVQEAKQHEPSSEIAEEMTNPIIETVKELHELFLRTPAHLLRLSFARLRDRLVAFTEFRHKLPTIVRELEWLGALEVLV